MKWSIYRDQATPTLSYHQSGRPSIHPSIHPSSKVCIEFSEDSSFIGATDEEEVCRRWQSERWLSLGGEGWSWKFSRSQDNRHNAHVTHAETCRGIVGAVECSNNQPYNLLDSQNIITHIVIPLQSYCNLNTTFRRLAMSPTCCKVMTNPLPVAYSTPAKWYYIINPTMSERIPWWKGMFYNFSIDWTDQNQRIMSVSTTTF